MRSSPSESSKLCSQICRLIIVKRSPLCLTYSPYGTRDSQEVIFVLVIERTLEKTPRQYGIGVSTDVLRAVSIVFRQLPDTKRAIEYRRPFAPRMYYINADFHINLHINAA